MTNPSNPYRKGPMTFKSNRKPQVVRQPKTIVYARCERTRRGVGARIQDIFMTTYSQAQWAKGPRCPNCDGRMVRLYEGKAPL